ncbi:MAG: methyltransferase domain-containing protein [Deltaproteobacteria bacterium]|nr:methyltransferase domain-containing protein [Deltaproteobacteria bacterium]
MAHRACPWWLGYFLASPLRRLVQDPHVLLAPFVSNGMTVLEPGPGMGFFTLELARLVGPEGRVVAIDVQPQMLAGLVAKAERAGLRNRIEAREPKGAHLGTEDLVARVDFVLAFAVLHELPSTSAFFVEVHRALRPNGRILACEPKLHVSAAAFEDSLSEARDAGLRVESRPKVRGSRSALLLKGV